MDTNELTRPKNAPSRFPMKLAQSIGDVTEEDVIYLLEKNPTHWLVIQTENFSEYDGTEYSVSFGPSGMYGFLTKGDKVHTWKTVKGAARFIKKEATKNSWSQWRDWVPVAEIEAVEAKARSDYEAERQKTRAAVNEQRQLKQEADAVVKELAMRLETVGIGTDFLVLISETTYGWPTLVFQFNGCAVDVTVRKEA